MATRSSLNKDNLLLDLIIKSHIYLEYKVDLLLTFYFPKPNKISNFSFSKKIDLVEGLDIFRTIEMAKWLRKVNMLRNNFAHNLNQQLKEEDIKEFFQTFNLRDLKEKITETDKDIDKMFDEIYKLNNITNIDKGHEDITQYLFKSIIYNIDTYLNRAIEIKKS